MKCLIRTFKTSDVKEIFQRYVNFHKIESTNYYLKALFKRDNNCYIKQTCDACGEIFHKKRYLKNHNFIRQYQVGGAQNGNKPLNILKKDGFIIYSIFLIPKELSMTF